jgi:hypothetical protein
LEAAIHACNLGYSKTGDGRIEIQSHLGKTPGDPHFDQWLWFPAMWGTTKRRIMVQASWGIK